MNSREIGLKILMDIKLKGAYSNYAINKFLKDEMDVKDENLIRELVYGVVENCLYLDHIISKLSKVKIKKIQPAILEILRMGVYQIAFMEKIPDRAAVNEAVILSKKYGYKGASGFVNGVLRNFSRNKESLMMVEEKNPITYLSIMYSHPKWMVERWVDEYGYEFTEKLCRENNNKPRLNIRVNRLKTSREQLMDSLSDYGYMVYKTKYAKDGIIVDNPIRITEVKEFKLGHFTIQDESSMLVSQIANPKEDSLVLDLCSAPGGKSTHMGELMGNKGRIISRDIYDHKLDLVRENFGRLGIDIIEIEIFNALDLDKSMVGKVDYCILDAPCSGLGIIRRKPDIKWNRKEEDIRGLKEIQINILNIAKHYVRPGGTIIYSTCTIGREENVDVVNEFLKDNKEFRLSGFEDSVDSIENIDTVKDGYVQLFPHIHGTDGFFIARIQKKND
ncbi:Ribosomal RNA small subunit methyltransferase B [[Clostridium] ultunense Esp]|uniref:16S rRNA (cytosine(967)-C(5))-methyltransferase n=1 Tax=[Clostridium] ultunense Esp TaxID=1288971 RepID=M1ZDP5_9FIRM|nr:16S rRNA (cytosine(967)-C(5))-methyltransferase RsmB [Schnuerera ultunensis]CCQ96058.1 Ribosomal RNA small subunit methyltransferase B [[Clostridium] ultunense Esp]SHD76951.1 RNA-binding Sun protein; 16S rRNA m5C967 methyltransferase, S-adenosyl-L-methionine-dependent [[Clostridium] ultunense Esp]